MKETECSVLRRSFRTLHRPLTRDRVPSRCNPSRLPSLGNHPLFVSAYLRSSRTTREAFPQIITRAHHLSWVHHHHRTRSTEESNCEYRGTSRLISPRGYLSCRKGQGEKIKILRHEDHRHVRQEEQRALRDSSRIGSYRGHDGNAPASEA